MSIKMSSYLRMVGLPYQLSESAAIKWFKENGSNGISAVHLVMNRESRPSGLGFAVFQTKDDAEQALVDLDRKIIDDSSRYVRLIPTDDNEYQWYVDLQKRQKEGNLTSLHRVRLSGLPYKIGEYEIAKWFQEADVECVDIQRGLSKHTKGLASAYFLTAEEASKAMTLNKKDMQGRYIELFQDNAPVTFNFKDCGDFGVLMSGLPFKITEVELKDFFRPAAECKQVRVVLNKNGMPSGDAIATFDNEEGVEAAMTCDKKYMGQRYIALRRSTGKEFSDSPAAGSEQQRYTHAVKMRGLPYSATKADVLDFFKSVADCVDVRFLQNRGGQPSGEAIAAFSSREDAEEAMKKQREYIGTRFVLLSLCE